MKFSNRKTQLLQPNFFFGFLAVGLLLALPVLTLAAPAAAPVVIVSNLISPTSMARDEHTGDIFVPEIFTGRIIRVQVL